MIKRTPNFDAYNSTKLCCEVIKYEYKTCSQVIREIMCWSYKILWINKKACVIVYTAYILYTYMIVYGVRVIVVYVKLWIIEISINHHIFPL